MFTLSRLGFFRPNAPASHPLGHLRTLLRVSQERQTLKSLPPERLCDIGRSASEAQTEANRSLWDVPNHWRR